MTSPKRAAGRSKLREWWPELLCAAILVVIALAGQKDDPLFAIFCAVIGAVFWAMGHRHRRLPMQATLDGVRQDVQGVREDVGDMRDMMHATVEALTPDDEPKRPDLRIVP